MAFSTTCTLFSAHGLFLVTHALIIAGTDVSAFIVTKVATVLTFADSEAVWVIWTTAGVEAFTITTIGVTDALFNAIGIIYSAA